MIVTIKYSIEVEKEVAMSAEEYLIARSDFSASGLFPKDSLRRELKIDEKNKELADKEISEFFEK